MALGPRGKRLYLIASYGTMPIRPESRQIHAWAIDDDGKARDLAWPVDLLPADEMPTALAIGPDGRTLAVRGRFGDVFLIDTESRKILHHLDREEDVEPMATGLAFSPRGQLLAAAAHDGGVRLWSIEGQRIQPWVRLPSQHGGVSNLAFDQSGRHIAATDDAGVNVWDLDRIQDELRALGLGR